MLTEGEANYLARLKPEEAGKPVQIFAWKEYGEEGLKVARQVIDQIKFALPDLEVVFIGSMALGISGQKDIDLSVISLEQNFPKYQPILETAFGKPDKLGKTSIGWHLTINDYDVGIYLTDPITSQIQTQIKVFNLLKNDSNVLQEYEQIKINYNNKPYKDYQIAKYEFYHKILGLEE